MSARITSGRTSWLLCACLILLPGLAAAAGERSRSIAADGHHQRLSVSLDRRALSTFQLSLSSPGGALPHSHQPPDTSGAADDDAGTSEEIALAGCVLFVLALCASPRAPAFEASRAFAPHTPRAWSPFTTIDPFSPRPPPAHSLL